MDKSYSFKPREKLTAVKNLPDPFIKPDGTRVETPEQWEEQREYLKEMLDYYMYGEVPQPPSNVSCELIDSTSLYGGTAIFEHLRLYSDRGISILAEITRPTAPGKHPVIIWNQFSNMERCPIEEEAVSRGYCILSFDRNQLAPDKEGVSEYTGSMFQKAYPEFPRARAVSIWAWGCSFCASWAEAQEWCGVLITTGFSRGGKTTMRAAAWDTRFKICLPVSSGAGGAGCFRFQGGRLGKDIGVCEGLGWLTHKKRFWYWFRDEVAEFGNPSGVNAVGNEEKLPFDLHTLRALIAPRAILCTEGLDDESANCYGTQITWRAAQEVYDFLDAKGKNAIAFFEGAHEFKTNKWQTILDFCDIILYGKEQKINYRRFASDKNSNVPKLHYDWESPEKK